MSAAVPREKNWNQWISDIGLVLMGLAVFASVFEFQFLTWDDNINITSHPSVVNLNWWAIWTKAYYGFYIPLTYSFWAVLSWMEGKPEPILFHGVNLVLHILNSALVLRILQRLRFSSAAAVAGACFFLVHPLQVETVAWASGARDLLSSAFALAAVLAFLNKRGRTALLLFALGLLAKPAVALLPVALLFLHRDETWRERSLRLWPWFLLAALAGVVSVYAQQGLGAGAKAAWYWRPLIAIDALGFYAFKTLLPFNLIVDYGRTPQVVIENQTYFVTGVLLALSGCILWLTGTLKYGALTAVLLFPVLGLFPFAFQYISTVADHYMYLPMLGVALTVAHLSAKNRPFKLAIWILVLLFAALSMDRSTVWRNDKVFYADILAKNPRSFQALTATGEQEERAGNFAAAIEHFRKALEISPVNGAAQVGLAKSLLEAGRFSDAYIFLDPLLRSKAKDYTAENQPYYGQLYYCLGLAEEKIGTPERAIRAFCNAQMLLPSDEVVANALKGARDTDASFPPCEELIEKEK